MENTFKFTGKGDMKFAVEITETGFVLYQESKDNEYYWLVDASNFSSNSKVKIAYPNTRWEKLDEESWAATYILKTN